MSERGEIFTAIYDRVVRRFWASGEPLGEAEFKAMVEAEGLTYPANRAVRPASAREAMRLEMMKR